MTNANPNATNARATDPHALAPGDRVKGYGGRIPACPFPCNFGTVTAAGPGAATVRWDSGQTGHHDPHELKRV